jgi:cell fate (sporulation/competence/biofilm development) regulator YlbF (YheA/YmcA/DUF963 family)
MSLLADNSDVMAKTKELCSTIATDPEYKSLLEKVEQFLANDAARLMYQGLHERGEELHQKQNAGLELGENEVKDFESARDALMENPVARDFMDAQQSLQNVQVAIGKYIGMTLELGHVPTAEEISASEQGGGCCGGSGSGDDSCCSK